MRLRNNALSLLALVAVAACERGSEAVPANAVVADPALAGVQAWAAGIESDAAPSANPSAQPVADLIGGLEARLEENPDDAEGWALLAQSYAYTGQMSDARDAVNRAVALGRDRNTLEARVEQVHTEGW